MILTLNGKTGKVNLYELQESLALFYNFLGEFLKSAETLAMPQNNRSGICSIGNCHESLFWVPNQKLKSTGDRRKSRGEN